MENKKFHMVYHQESEWIVALCTENGVVSQGKSFQEADSNIREAISLYLESFGPDDDGPDASAVALESA